MIDYRLRSLRSLRRSVAVTALAGCAGAAPEPIREAAVRAGAAGWVAGDPAADPLADHRPEGAECAEGGVYVEGGALEVDTGRCAYAWLQQPMLADLVYGDVVEIVFWHSSLSAVEPTEGHLALTVGDELLYERWVEIPADAAAYTDRVLTPIDGDAGAPIGLHVHNHGANTWNLLRVERDESDQR